MPSEYDDYFDDEDRTRPPRHREADDEYDDRPRRRRPEPAVEATDFLIPTNVSGYSIASCYFGLVSCFLPLIGLLFALIALVCGIIALRRRKKGATYGSVTSDIRAIVGIVLSSLTILVHIGIVAYPIIKKGTA